MKTLMLCPWCLKDVERQSSGGETLRLPRHTSRGGAVCGGSGRRMADRITELQKRAIDADRVARIAKRQAKELTKRVSESAVVMRRAAERMRNISRERT